MRGATVRLAAGLVLGWGCARAGRGAGSSAESMAASFHGQGAYASVVATLSAESASGESVATLSVRGAPAGAVFSWRLYQGSCGRAAPVVGNGVVYAPLTVDDAGRAQSTARLRTRLDPGRTYFVEVMAPNGRDAVGCANLVPSGPG